MGHFIRVSGATIQPEHGVSGYLPAKNFRLRCASRCFYLQPRQASEEKPAAENPGYKDIDSFRPILFAHMWVGEFEVTSQPLENSHCAMAWLP
jgi:hypothetical protein